MTQLEKQLKVINRLGLHARAAAKIAASLEGLECEVMLVKDGISADARSVLEILTLDAPQGSELVVKASGPQASAAVAALEELFAEGFGEDTGG